MVDRTVYNDPFLARAYDLVRRLFRVNGTFHASERAQQIEERFMEVMYRKYPDEDWEGIAFGIRMHEE